MQVKNWQRLRGIKAFTGENSLKTCIKGIALLDGPVSMTAANAHGAFLSLSVNGCRKSLHNTHDSVTRLSTGDNCLSLQRSSKAVARTSATQLLCADIIRAASWERPREIGVWYIVHSSALGRHSLVASSPMFPRHSSICGLSCIAAYAFWFGRHNVPRLYEVWLHVAGNTPTMQINNSIW